MKLKLKDFEAKRDKVEETTAHPNDDNEDPLYQWVRPTHLDANMGNPDPHVATRARDYRINVKKVLEEEVGVDVIASGSSNTTTTNSSSVNKSINDGSDGGWGIVREYEDNPPSLYTR